MFFSAYNFITVYEVNNSGNKQRIYGVYSRAAFGSLNNNLQKNVR